MSVSTLPRIFGGVGVSDDLTFRPSTGMSESGTAATLSLNFITEAILMAYQRKNLTDIVTFTRASTKTYFGSDGLLKTAAVNGWPLEYDPVTLAPIGRSVWEARTNLMTYSEQFDNAAWVKTASTLVVNAVVAPDGILTADKLVESTTNADHGLSRNSLTVTPGAHTVSVFVKAGERGFAFLWLDNGGGDGNTAEINLSTGATRLTRTGGANYSNVSTRSEPVGNGWYRFSLTATTALTIVQQRVYFSPSAWVSGNFGTPQYTGDGTSGIYIWGAQLEAGAFATPYIPTTPTFTSRASTATYFDQNGVLQTAAINEARTGYGLVGNTWVSQGLILEAAATNLLTYSEQFDNAAWTKSACTISPNAITAPDGTLMADLLVEDITASASHSIQSSVSITTTASGTTYTTSIFVKANGRTRFTLTYFTAGAWPGSVNPTVRFDLVAKTSTVILGSSTTGRITDVGAGWFRCELSATAAANLAIGVILNLLDGSNNSSYTGDGTSGIYIWGAQLEAGSTATSYIKTEGTTITRAADVSSSAATTRAADVAVMTGANFSDWYNQTEGTFVVEASIAATPNAGMGATPVFASAGSANNAIYAGQVVNVSGGLIRSLVSRESAADQAVINHSGMPAIGAVYRTAGAYKLNDFAGSARGVTPVVDTAGNVPTVNQLSIGGTSGVSQPLNGHIRSITYYPKRLSNAQLQALSS